MNLVMDALPMDGEIVEPASLSRCLDLGPLESLPLGQGRCFAVSGRRIAVFRQRDGRIFACDDACPHAGGPLSDGILGGGRLICPLHNRSFDLRTGDCAEGGARLSLHAVSLIDGRIVVMLPEEI
ncbi:MAG: Rieske 2Fe-2S domain-containing protein [Deltaproteobacteria bacterium]